MEKMNGLIVTYILDGKTLESMEWNERIFSLIVLSIIGYFFFSLLAIVWRTSEGIEAWRDKNVAHAKYFKAQANYIERKKDLLD
jgi:hypothetical protein